MNSKREEFLIYCMQFIKVPYIWGGDNPKIGLDCSGLVQILLAYLNLDPPGDQTADELMKYFLQTGTKMGFGQPTDSFLGCLVFFGTHEKATHVAMMLSENLMIEAAGGDHTCTTAEIALSKGAFIRVSPMTHRSDKIMMAYPAGLPW